MTMHKTFSLAAVALVACLTGAAQAMPMTIFDDDFEDTPALTNGNDAATQTELNSGVATGSWTVTDAVNGTILLTSASNTGIRIDRGSFDLTANFSQAGFVGEDATVITFDFHSTRDTPNANQKPYTFTGLEGGTQLFELTVLNPNNNNKSLSPDTSSDTLGGIEEAIGGFNNGQLRSIQITLSATSYDIWLDGDNDGNVDANETLLGVSYTNNPTTGITALQFEGSGTEGSGTDGAGVALDNILVTTIPEPASLALVALGGLMMIRRRA